MLSPLLRQPGLDHRSAQSKPGRREGTRMPEDSLCQVGASVGSTDPAPGCRADIWSQHHPKGSRDNWAFRAAPLPDGHSRGGHDRPGVTRALWPQSPPGGSGAAREHISRGPSGPATPVGAARRGEGAGCAKWPAKPNATQPKGQYVYSASHPEPCRHLLPSEGHHPEAAIQGPRHACSELSPTSCAQLPATGTPAACHCGGQSHEARVFGSSQG